MKEAPDMEFVGKRIEGQVHNGNILLLNRTKWTEMLKRAPGMEFVGKRVLDNGVTGRRVPGAGFVG